MSYWWRWRALSRRRRRRARAVVVGVFRFSAVACTGLAATSEQLTFHPPDHPKTESELDSAPSPNQSPNPQASRSAATGRMHQVWAVRASVDPFLDVARSTFNRLTGRRAQAPRSGGAVCRGAAGLTLPTGMAIYCEVAGC
jgi:hypothetical protein